MVDRIRMLVSSMSEKQTANIRNSTAELRNFTTRDRTGEKLSPHFATKHTEIKKETFYSQKNINKLHSFPERSLL
jgi:hypothetical protein